MSSITAILRKKPNKQGQYLIYIRIIKDRKSSFIALGYYIDMEQWDEKKKYVNPIPILPVLTTLLQKE